MCEKDTNKEEAPIGCDRCFSIGSCNVISVVVIGVKLAYGVSSEAQNPCATSLFTPAASWWGRGGRRGCCRNEGLSAPRKGYFEPFLLLFTKHIEPRKPCNYGLLHQNWCTIGALWCTASELVPLFIKSCEGLLLHVFGHICVDVQSSGNIGMPQGFLYHLHVDSCFAHSGCECVSEDVAAKVRKENSILFSFKQDFMVAITDDPAKRFIQCPLMLGITEAINENEIRIAVHCGFAANSIRFLILFFLKEGLLHKRQHCNLANTARSLGGLYIAIAAIDRVSVVNKSVVHIDDAIFEINVRPSESNSFSDSHPCADHYSKHRIPMLILLCSFQKVQE